MRELCRILVLVAAGAFLLAPGAQGQDDAPSLGDAARQARLQKQQKETQAKDPAKDASTKGAQAKDSASPDKPGKDASSKDASGKDAAAKDEQAHKAPHVVTNDEIPEHVGPIGTSASGYQDRQYAYQQPSYGNNKLPAEAWSSQILSVKTYIASLQSNIKSLESSIHYAGGSCVSNCVQWNERQQQKQQQVEVMKTQLEEQQKHLEDMQESARKQGYGSSVYDP